jgi:hypothetical protein
MEFIGSIILVGATIACVVMVFSATLIMGVKILSPLTDLIYQNLVIGPREQHPGNRADALFFTGVIPVFLAFVTLIAEFVKLEEGGHTVIQTKKIISHSPIRVPTSSKQLQKGCPSQ